MKDIKGYEGQYAVTSCGKVWSYKTQKFLTPFPGDKGRLRVKLCKDGKTKNFYIARLVAEAYIPNPLNLPQCNHRDENVIHNWVNNLEWCDAKYNINYGTRNERAGQKLRKPVRCIELDRVFPSQTIAAQELGLWQGNITKVCNGLLKTTGGFHFEFVKEELK